ncbi:shikimate kinase [Trueperella pyogenes]|uniref:Shikimate kinase n=1 Tax=Trueperella pyogenes TaxID=1661 RepID=A0ABV3NBV7_9ACTO|nr:shikimate kinase [Trueperella pyogenes]AHU90353.1 hypothetical protein CQ11_00670 [Trueperella pyogenes]AZR00387.1 hypothetical protein EB776_03170 [Trueperella pyogenes]OQD39771.1 hypothetical protein B1R42_01675 [Trueperella pyogenes]OQD40082.1 hypothetical protein B1R42_01085 [Trueperella pyogenes]OQD40375.1 hypothetical protein B1R42_00665 [Trueperella pyogenes]
MSALVLVGAPGTGKTSVVGELARLGWNAADAGAVAATMRALTVEDFYLLTDTDERQRTLAQVLETLLDDIEAAPEARWGLAVPSEGLGESVDDDGPFASIRQRLRASSCMVVHLTADLSTLMTRNGLIGPRSATLVMPRKELRSMLERRLSLYDAVATHTYDTTSRSVQEVARALISLISYEKGEGYLL